MRFSTIDFEKKYPSKLILLGEYAVLYGSEALAVPNFDFYGSWQFADSTHSLLPFFTYSQQLSERQMLFSDLQLSDFGAFLSANGAFVSNIPCGYGLGSSGTLCAAVYDAFSSVTSHDDLTLLKKQLAQLESFFHGNSSGIDPLVSYLQQPILFTNSEIRIAPPTIMDVVFDKKIFTLLDSQQPRLAHEWIALFHTKMTDSKFATPFAEKLVPAVSDAIHYLLQQSYEHFFRAVGNISQFQYEYMREWIPTTLQRQWKQGLDSGDYFIKLCGAGGGGYFLMCRIPEVSSAKIGS